MERTIVLVDDHSLFRNGLRGLLEHCAGCRVVGEAASGEEFLAMLPELEADIVFMDFAMPGIDGAQATERALARRPELRIITLSMFGEEEKIGAEEIRELIAQVEAHSQKEKK